MVTLVINTGGLREAYKCTVQREVNVKKPQNKKGRSGPEPSCKAKEEEERGGGKGEGGGGSGGSGGEEDKDHALPCKFGIRLPIESNVVSQKNEILSHTAVRTANSTRFKLIAFFAG